jgi:hypothetical protein
MLKIAIPPAITHRKSSILLGLSIIFSIAQAFNQEFHDPLLIIKDGKYLYVDKNSKPVIPEQFDCAGSFIKGYARICGKNVPDYLINLKGEKLVIPQAASYGFSEGLIVVEIEGKYGYVNEKLESVIPPQFDMANDFSEGLASVKIAGKYGYIDKTGKFVIKPQFDEAKEFSEGLAAIGFTSKEKPKDMDIFYNPMRYGYIDKSAKVVIDPIYGQASRFSEGLAAVSIEKKDSGTYILLNMQIECGPIAKCGYIDRNGRVVIAYKFKGASSFSEGLAAVKIGNKFGYIDKNDKIIIKPTLEYAGEFHDGLARVYMGETEHRLKGSIFEIGFQGKTGYINRTGEFESPNLHWDIKK